MIGAAKPHPVLSRLFADLESRRVDWVLLRAPASLAAPDGDVDVLVAPDGFGTLRDAAERLGFLALPGWESPANLILVTYDAPTGRWLLLDVVTSLGFRSVPGWRLPVGAGEVLARRRVRDGVAQLADGDAFWLLLLHCLLDRGAVAPRYRATLSALAGASAESRVGLALSARTPWAHAGLVAAVGAGEWERLDSLGRRLAADLRRHRSPGERARGLAGGLLAVARKPLLLPRRRGTSLALLGPNGVGKSTVANALKRRVPLETRIIHMGLWRTDGWAAAALRPLRVWRRYALAQYHQLRGRLVIFDRYVDEARLPAKGSHIALKRPYFWLLSHAVPPPGARVVLDVPGPVAYRRKGENPPDELEEERCVYRGLSGVQIVDASRELTEVRAELEAIVWRSLARRWTRSASAEAK